MAKKGGLGRGMEALIAPRSGKQDSDQKKADSRSLAEEKNAEKEETIKIGTNSPSNAGKSKKDAASLEKSKSAGASKAKKEDAGEPVTTAKSSNASKAGSGETTKTKKNSSSTTTKTKKTSSGGTAKTNKISSGGTIKTKKAESESVLKEDQMKATVFLPINRVEPNRDQPRKVFDEDALQELAESLKTYGVLQPLLVQKENDYYRIIAGERRWRAARIAGLKEIPVIIKELTEKEILEISLIENLQREDLNPIEEANAYERLLKEFQMTQEELATRVSKSRSAIANTLRLLRLSEPVRKMLADGVLSEGHARALLPVEEDVLQEEIAERIVRDRLSVRDTEKLVRALIAGKKGKQIAQKDPHDYIYRNIEETMRQILGTKVTIRNGKNSGRIEISYYSPDELDRILEMIQSIH